MKSYAENRFNQAELSAFNLATMLVPLLPNRSNEYEDIRCHEIARIFANVISSIQGIDLYVQDGCYGFIDHSWLWTSVPGTTIGRVHCPNILDPYAVGSLPQVRLVDCSASALPHFGAMYQLGPVRTDIDHAFVDSLTRSLVYSLTKKTEEKNCPPTQRS
jgi:hypothetical protein